MNPKYYGLKIYYKRVRVYQTILPQKIMSKMTKIDFFRILNFFHICFPLFNLSHIPIDRAWLALQNYLYGIFHLAQIWGKTLKNFFFCIIKISFFFSILLKWRTAKSITKIIYTPSCSPLNSASNVILPVSLQRSAVASDEHKDWRLTSFLAKSNTVCDTRFKNFLINILLF